MKESRDFETIRDLYDAVSDDDSASYEVFRKKLRRLGKGNVRTTNTVLRKVGIEPKRKYPPEPSRDFVSYDGEGWDNKYVLLANSLGDSISNPEGLTSKECLDFLSQRFNHPAYRVFFSFGYDVNHIIADLDDDDVLELLAGRMVRYEGHTIHYTPGKIFRVDGYNYYDIFSFFSTSFLNVVRLMLGSEYVTASLIEGKSARGSFETWDLEKIAAYNQEELDLIVMICDKLKLALENIGVKLTQWYGPGCIAKYWFREHQISPVEKHTRGTLTALNSAYYGGRFENPVLGKVSRVYQYDLHSAYPSVMVDMPNFRSWKHVKRGDFIDDPYSIWYISFDLRANQQHEIGKGKVHTFMPLPVRTSDGRVCFPMVGKGWYWYSEVKVMLDFFPEAKVIYHEGYVAKVEGSPFAWIKQLYDYRRVLKANNDLSQYAIKVGLNSLYGKTAQRVGSAPYFSLAWAGYITAGTRAKLARAGYENGSQHVLGFATDSIISDAPMPKIKCSEELGDWEEQRYDYAIFFQSGVYRLIKDKKNDDRYRGSSGRLGIDDIIAQLREHPTSYPSVKIVRFISALLAIKSPRVYGPHRLEFWPVQHELRLDAPYKRHYIFPLHGVNETGIVRNYGAMLTQRIDSTPKVYSEDNNPMLTWKYQWGELPLHNVESQPPPMKDTSTMRLLEEAELLAQEAGYSDPADLPDLDPIIEDEVTMG